MERMFSCRSPAKRRVENRIDGEREFLVPGFVRGVNFWSNFTGNEKHEFDDEGKKECSLTLCSEMALKNAVQFGRTENILEHPPGHDGHGGIFGEAIEQFILKHGTPPCECDET